MRLDSVHLLLTLRCDRECDHCFVWSSPNVICTMSISMIRKVIDQAAELDSLRMIYFEGGEPFLFYPILVEGVKYARSKGFEVGIVTNGYWGTSGEDAELWLRELERLSISDMSVSDDRIHRERDDDHRARIAAQAASAAGMRTSVLETCEPKGMKKGDIFFRGRAAEELARKYRTHLWSGLTECPEELRSPERVHIDPDGNVHVCQGIVIGNINRSSLVEISASYMPSEHPILGPLMDGGPAQLARRYRIAHLKKYADACDLCYHVRKKLRPRFKKILGPDVMYGVSEA